MKTIEILLCFLVLLTSIEFFYVERMYKYVNISENEYKKKAAGEKADKGQSEVSYHK
jgi:hypothetical protein